MSGKIKIQIKNRRGYIIVNSCMDEWCIVLGRQSGVSRNFHEKTPDVTHFQASNLCENHILLRGPVIYFRGEEPEKGQAWRKCG